VFVGLIRPQESDRPADLKEKVPPDLDAGVLGLSVEGLSCAFLQSSPLASVDDGAVDAALKRDELSVVEAVLVLEAPLPL
jgi:hypothetical protein